MGDGGWGAWGEERRACMHPSALKLYREKKDWFYRPSARVILLVDARTSWCPSSTCACPSPTTAPFPSRLPPPPSLSRTYLVGLAADAAGLSGLLRTDSSEWSARGGGLAYRGKAARAPAGAGGALGRRRRRGRPPPGARRRLCRGLRWLTCLSMQRRRTSVKLAGWVRG